MPNALASYLPREREAAAREALTEAVAFRDTCLREWESRNTITDSEELRVLGERCQGARAAVRNWERYINNGCPRAR